jgi:exopolysaccharide biosynthesis polyprenyl glycosylphosphotransferase
MKRADLIFTFLLIPMDIIMFILAFVLAYKARFYFEIVPAAYFEPFREYLKSFIILVPFWIGIFALSGLYAISERRSTMNEFGKIIVAVSAATALLLSWIFLSRTFFFSRLIIGFIWLFSIITITFGRFLIRFIKRYLYKYGVGVHRLIILGQNSFTKPIINEIKKNKRLGYKLVKVIDRDGIEKLGKIIENNPCDEIMIADSTLTEGMTEKVLEFCRLNRITFQMTPNLFLVRSSHVSFQSLAGVPILEFNRTPLDGWGKIIKRTIDIVGSIFLIILTSPLMLITAILVKLTSHGPILFRQERVGLEKNFTFYKFRTMRENAHEEHEKYMKKYGVMFKLKKDPRLTSVGCFLRKTSLDELPQFFNVLKGDMSLIGPRPPMPEEVAKYNNWQKQRLGVKPGISGLWQVSGRSELSFDEWVKLDAYYIENWSLWLDFQIFLKTIWVIIAGRGAY